MTAFNLNGKRARGDEDDDITQLPEHKKTFGASLPFRTSPTIKHTRLFSQLKRKAPITLLTQTITPTDSEDEVSPQCPTDPIRLSEPSLSHIQVVERKNDQQDVEMGLSSPQRSLTPREWDLDSMMLSPKASPFTVLPSAHFNVGSCTMENTVRIPTPICGHFQQTTDTQSSASVEPPSQSAFDCDYEKHMHARRLPTPISEDEAMDTFDTWDADMDDIPPSQLRQPARLAPPIASQSLKRNKPMFSMGFRADCDMCRNRVPGHYNHIFWA